MAKLVSDFNDYLIQRESEKKAITSNLLETSFKYSVVVYLGTKQQIINYSSALTLCICCIYDNRCICTISDKGCIWPTHGNAYAPCMATDVYTLRMTMHTHYV